MKKALKILGILLGVLVVVAGGFFAYVQLTWSLDHPDTPYPKLAASTDPAVIARGEYLVHHVAHCSTCHQPGELVDKHTLDTTAPLVGGKAWQAGPFGTFVAANITPSKDGIGDWSDEELARAIKHSVGKDGRLLPFMRLVVAPMGDEDVVAIMSFLRAQKPADGAHPRSELGFVGKMISGSLTPRTAELPEHVPAGEPSVERGRYLAEGPAHCFGCHTSLDPMDGFAPTMPRFSGVSEPEPDPTDEGFAFVIPNLTPDPETGHIAAWDEKAFVARMKGGRVFPGSKMPWEAYAGMSDADLASIYRFLKTVEPVKHAIGPTRIPR